MLLAPHWWILGKPSSAEPQPQFITRGVQVGVVPLSHIQSLTGNSRPVYRSHLLEILLGPRFPFHSLYGHWPLSPRSILHKKAFMYGLMSKKPKEIERCFGVRPLVIRLLISSVTQSTKALCFVSFGFAFHKRTKYVCVCVCLQRWSQKHRANLRIH